MQCPTCSQELADSKFCRRCGTSAEPALRQSVNEPPVKQRVADEPADSNRTIRLGTVDLSPQAPAEPVIPLTGLDDTSAEPDAPVEVKDPEPTPRGSRRADAGSGRRARRAAPEYDRSVRMLARTILISNVLTMIVVAGVALFFGLSQQQSADTAQKHFIEMNEKLSAALERSDARVGGLEQKTASLEQSYAGLAQSYAQLEKQSKAGMESAVRAMLEAFAEARLSALPAKLSPGERKAISSAVAALGTKTKDKNLAAFGQKLASNPDRQKLFKEATRRVLPNLDERARPEFKENVVGVLLGD